jgi:uracil-DNA glycosylase
LKNIYTELKSDIGKEIPVNGDLSKWANQGVLLLNTTLTVEEGKPDSHKSIGWEKFTDAIIELISAESQHLVFMLWGAKAQQKKPLIDESNHLILTAPHPSPLSVYRGFYGCQHFSKTNEYLKVVGKKPIAW